VTLTSFPTVTFPTNFTRGSFRTLSKLFVTIYEEEFIVIMGEQRKERERERDLHFRMIWS
jgi:hypothetical protein